MTTATDSIPPRVSSTMRLALLLILLVPLASAQFTEARTDSAMGPIDDVAAAQGTIVRPFEVTLTVSGMICTQDTTFTVPLQVDVLGNATAIVEPASLDFTVPAGLTLTDAWTGTRTALVTATGNDTAQILISTEAAQGSCASLPGGSSAGTDAQGFMVTWRDAGADDGPPEQIMPAPLVLYVLAFLCVARARDNGPK